MSEIEVRADFDGIWALFDGGGAWVEFAPDRPVEPALFDVMTDALMAANAADMPDDIATGVSATVAGPDLALCESVARWAQRSGGPDVYLISGVVLLDRTGELGRHLKLALHTGMACATCVSTQAGPSSWVTLVPNGQASYQVHDPSLAPLTQADRAREALLVDCARTRWAAVMLADRNAFAWNTLNTAVGQTWASPSWTSARNNHVWSGYVPDAFGMQLLTADHLDRVADLSNWSVTEVASARHLVQALDLADWFGPSGPSAEVVARARADFGPAIAPADLPER
jgi:hypothetical protein